MRPAKRATTLSLSVDLRERLDSEAARLGLSRSAFVESFLRASFQEASA